MLDHPYSVDAPTPVIGAWCGARYHGQSVFDLPATVMCSLFDEHGDVVTGFTGWMKSVDR